MKKKNINYICNLPTKREVEIPNFSTPYTVNKQLNSCQHFELKLNNPPATYSCVVCDLLFDLNDKKRFNAWKNRIVFGSR
ncbi:hypothetical protein SSABA_v1c04970 [Spiroplasma sabaudiense Ar-1343]|uniref:Uncharacterized protein n=1 Tax=Spiroplasma sabaudiense Ar-1343 TaxID=1276257 RepID=W6AJK4_9MOLU|nr:hypothetical protein [Spiroplasma sabaudiense]AHI53904.1 hypothetical protein SSABA_v1c04970 [Spiroplasma sabaudiense Ar-1343]